MNGVAGTLEVVKDADALAGRAAEIIAAKLKGCQAPFRLVLSGGSTPVSTYHLLARRPGLDWPCVEIFLSDERFVPPDHQDSNYRMVRETLLAGEQIRPRKLFVIPTDDTPDSAAARYDEMLRQQYGAGELEAGVPLFDLTILGLGEDGHTASLLPGQPVLQEHERWAAAVPDGRPEPRITLTYPALNASRTILFLVSGAAKRDVLAQVRAQAPAQARDASLPAGGLQPMGEVIWLADAAAAGQDDQGYGF